MKVLIFEIIMFSPIIIAMGLITLLLFALFYYFIKIIKIFLIKYFHIDRKLLDKVHIILFVSINILISAYFFIMLLYDINTYGVDLTAFIDKDNQVYIGTIIFNILLILESIIISFICIFKNTKLYHK
ncbi:hypothetical protein R4K55_02155 [Brachyspira alvinipulli]|uniref:hypothetical protein n=1 Tax=Brachyspira alvinipulli TaxID=84379 RepID=UPI003005340D